MRIRLIDGIDDVRILATIDTMISRRHFVKQSLSTAGLAASGAALAEDATVTLPFENGARKLVKYPQKRPLIVLTSRPPQLETPFSVFNDGVFTPNDAFFVRYHLANIPLTIDPATYRLEVKGLVDKPLKLSLAELKSQFEHVEVAAVNQCSGNSRGFFKPRVGGGQLGHERWEMQSGKACGSKMCSTRRACRPRRSKSCAMASTRRCCRRRRIS